MKHTSKIYWSLVLLLMLILPIVVFAQISEPCGTTTKDDVILISSFQSSTIDDHPSSIANDGVVSGNFSNGFSTLTHLEENPYWEAELEEVIELDELTIYYPAEFYTARLQDFYILTSEYPVFSRTLNENISNEHVKSIHVNTSISNGSTIPLLDTYARYIRIQLGGVNSRQLGLNEVEIQGYIVPGGGGGEPEDCFNGIDDDCDGRVDCDDPDCGPIIYAINHINPACEICNNGQITLSVDYFEGASDLLYSLDGGVNFLPFNSIDNFSGIHIFDDLDVGVYEVVVTNGSCFANATISLTAPITGVESDCPNGGFENGDFSDWNLAEGSYVEGEFGDWTAIPNTSTSDGFNLIQSGNYFDPFLLGGTNIVSPTGGTYIAVLGDRDDLFIGGNDAYNMINCFEVTADNSSFAFNFALVLADPNHPPEAKPLFIWQMFPINDVQSTLGGNVFVSGTAFFDENNGTTSVLGWNCQDVDLSSHIGETVCIQFLLTECGANGGSHGAYAYIDAICQAPEENIPNCNFTLGSDMICESQVVSFNLEEVESNNFIQYSINICDGPICSNLPIMNGFAISDFSIQDLASAAGINLVSGN